MRTMRALHALPGFADLPPAEALLLARHLELVHLAAGQSVLLSRAIAQELLLVVDGRLDALGSTRWTVRSGAVLGARGLLSRTPQPHGFRAVGPALVAYASVDQARVLMSASPAFATAVAVALCEELQRLEAAAASTGP